MMVVHHGRRVVGEGAVLLLLRVLVVVVMVMVAVVLIVAEHQVERGLEGHA